MLSALRDKETHPRIPPFQLIPENKVVAKSEVELTDSYEFIEREIIRVTEPGGTSNNGTVA